ncbi:MAG: imidazole glycerol phosphate synthase, glutamine amidotransferase subunit [Alphaproteobacteria bacterium RIFCSPLOWO2_01_FULL_40_26]|nr:MAG: imidazole glycerol phosphate synthase, glutamine amidotransferase subunit [Alphaproteobacteria bacterium RIFCSPHIGHO2_02_FULL_40_34]OFW95006.1 MAG: imidazole glycerol phosphate synthase, glutamine amidotransferase subunit [Alphaproteobacteria bacterium RIFCSPLOWO2_01_FULL_40_26]OFX10546.1 MAG: imidazole glycerol phosphate synthase, glutamine amidotransferase subunit [Alphaproteobacteria bacterium RIFCSPLOWO2_02_FULL_40_19]OFX12089.1 MAG: imidazole glycerol phosphate synthase, glutamine a
MKILIIDYGAGNVCSVANALSHIANPQEITVSNKISDLKSANYLILPGVGAFGDCMDSLKNMEGFLPEMRNQVLKEKKPFLGICVGMQVLANIGYENGEHQGLGFINGHVEKIPQILDANSAKKSTRMRDLPQTQSLFSQTQSLLTKKSTRMRDLPLEGDGGSILKIPHMGWNDIIIKPNKHAVLQGIENGEHFYFANSYHFVCQNENNVLAQVEYGDKLTAIVAKENIFGVQFHPEKSGETGLKLLKNFLNWRP